MSFWSWAGTAVGGVAVGSVTTAITTQVRWVRGRKVKLYDYMGEKKLDGARLAEVERQAIMISDEHGRAGAELRAAGNLAIMERARSDWAMKIKGEPYQHQKTLEAAEKDYAEKLAAFEASLRWSVWRWLRKI